MSGASIGKTPSQALVRSDSERKARIVLSDVDLWTAWFYKPHTLIFSFVGAALLVWASGVLQAEEHNPDPASNVKR